MAMTPAGVLLCRVNIFNKIRSVVMRPLHVYDITAVLRLYNHIILRGKRSGDRLAIEHIRRMYTLIIGFGDNSINRVHLITCPDMDNIHRMHPFVVGFTKDGVDRWGRRIKFIQFGCDGSGHGYFTLPIILSRMTVL